MQKSKWKAFPSKPHILVAMKKGKLFHVKKIKKDMIIIQIMWTIPRRWKARHGLMDWTNLARTPERAAPKAQPVLLSYESDTEASPSQPGFAWDLKLGFFRFTVMTRKPSTQYTTLNGGKLSKATKPLIVGYVTCLSRSERVQRDSVSKGSRMDTWTLPASGIRIGITS